MDNESIQRNEQPTYVQPRPLESNYGINRANPTSSRDLMVGGGPAMAALKMVVDGALVVLNVSPVMGGAWGRGAADLG